jgi:hypothetical protein
MTLKTLLPVLICALSFAGETQPSDKEKILCSEESSKRLARLALHGEARFSELKLDMDSCTASSVDFAEIGADRRRRRGRSKSTTNQSTNPQMGNLVTIKGLAKEKVGWRDIVVHCGVHKNKVSTFTYELLSMNSNLSDKFNQDKSSYPPQTPQ